MNGNPVNGRKPSISTHSNSGAGRPCLHWLAGIAAALFLVSQAEAQTPLESYDASVLADSSLSTLLNPVATLTTPAVLSGTGGFAFDFGTTSGDVTMEFILKGNPAASVSSFLAVGTNNPKSRLVYESWPDSQQLGFTQGGVDDYLFNPAVASPTNDTHVTFVWSSTSTTMKVYVNGNVVGSRSGVDAAFAMPTGWGWLGAAGQGADEAMSGTIYRVTVYGGIEPDNAIKRHASAFGAQVRPALDSYDTAITADSGLTPTAKLTSTVSLNGTAGVDFNFGATSGDVTIEFILEGDPSFNNSAFLAMGENPNSSLRYELWDNTGQLGFTQSHVADYPFSPGVPSPTLPTHVTYAWNAATLVMTVYINGVLAGTTASVSSDFVMPSGQGRLGDNGTGERMMGTIYRVTVYDTLLADNAILRHARAFADLLSPPTIVAFNATPSTIAPGASATLNWKVKDTLKVTINGVDQTGVTNLTVSPQVSTRYVLVAQNALGATTAELRLQVTPDLSSYDAVIATDASSGLVPLATLTNVIGLSGTGVPFNFGTNAGDGTMEFILEGDPNPGSGTAIANDYDDTGLWRNSLRYSQWPTTWQLGFTKRAVDDYVFSPLVPSPNWPTHITFVWDAAAIVVKVYINGILAGQNTTADAAFSLPSGQGTLGDGMLGAIMRITSYAGKLSEDNIRKHAKAFLAAARPSLNAYDNAIESTSATGTKPIGRLLAPVILTGAGGVGFDFGTNADDGTFEFILEGDPSASVSSFLAVSANNTASRLTYESWNDTQQLGFTQGGVDDYLFTPAVPSPVTPTHIAYVWNPANTTMKLYVNGILAGTKTGVSSSFALPSELGVLGDSTPTGEPMVGTIYRVTAYDSLLSDATILNHATAFAAQPPSVAVSVNLGTATASVLLSRGVAGQHYRVEYRNSLAANDAWQLLQDIPSLNGTTAVVPDPTPITGRTQRYYRAALVP